MHDGRSGEETERRRIVSNDGRHLDVVDGLLADQGPDEREGDQEHEREAALL